MSDSLGPHGLWLFRLFDHGILRARILEWVAISFSKGSSRPKAQSWISCIAGRFFTPVFLPGESHGQRNLAGCSPQGHKESGTAEATKQARMCQAISLGMQNAYLQHLGSSSLTRDGTFERNYTEQEALVIPATLRKMSLGVQSDPVILIFCFLSQNAHLLSCYDCAIIMALILELSLILHQILHNMGISH